MSGPIRVACVGTGFFSQFQYRAWVKIPGVQLVALCNRTRERGESVAREFGVPAVYTELATMLEEQCPDLLDIITPPETHLAAIRIAADHKVNVICQKPFCETLAQAQEATAIAEAAGIRLVIHENFRFQPWYGAIKGLLDAGQLGQVYQATFRLRPGDGQGERAYLDRQPYFQTMPRLLVHETAIHLIDVFRYLFGEVGSVIAALRRLNPVIAGEDSGLIILDMVDGVRCVFDGNRLSDHPARNRRLTMGEMLIEGERGALSLNGDGEIHWRAHGDNSWSAIAYPWADIDFGGDCVRALQTHIIEALVAGTPVQNTARDYLANIAIEEAVYHAHTAGARVTLA